MVLTSPRSDGVDYLDETIASLEAAGAREFDRIIYSDGEIASCRWSHFEGWKRVQHTHGPSGSLLGTLRAFNFFLNGTSAETLLFFEDDILACRNLIEKMASTVIPEDDAFASFFDCNDFVVAPHEGDLCFKPGFHRFLCNGRKANGFWHTQALLLPRRSVRWFVDSHIFGEIQGLVDQGKPLPNIDISMGEAFMKSPFKTYLRHYPSLVEHIGDVSRLGFENIRRASGFVGVECDAMSLGKEIHDGTR
jgi:hypothetical protein